MRPLRTLALTAPSLLVLLAGCGSSDDCLAYNENCTQAYKQSQYGRTTIQCCGGAQCEAGVGNGVLVCK